MHEAPRELSADRSIGVASDKVESKVSRIARGVVRVCGGGRDRCPLSRKDGGLGGGVWLGDGGRHPMVRGG